MTRALVLVSSCAAGVALAGLFLGSRTSLVLGLLICSASLIAADFAGRSRSPDTAAVAAGLDTARTDPFTGRR